MISNADIASFLRVCSSSRQYANLAYELKGDSFFSQHSSSSPDRVRVAYQRAASTCEQVGYRMLSDVRRASTEKYIGATTGGRGHVPQILSMLWRVERNGETARFRSALPSTDPPVDTESAVDGSASPHGAVAQSTRGGGQQKSALALPTFLDTLGCFRREGIHRTQDRDGRFVPTVYYGCKTCNPQQHRLRCKGKAAPVEQLRPSERSRAAPDPADPAHASLIVDNPRGNIPFGAHAGGVCSPPRAFVELVRAIQATEGSTTLIAGPPAKSTTSTAKVVDLILIDDDLSNEPQNGEVPSLAPATPPRQVGKRARTPTTPGSPGFEVLDREGGGLGHAYVGPGREALVPPPLPRNATAGPIALDAELDESSAEKLGEPCAAAGGTSDSANAPSMISAAVGKVISGSGTAGVGHLPERNMATGDSSAKCSEAESRSNGQDNGGAPSGPSGWTASSIDVRFVQELQQSVQQAVAGLRRCNGELLRQSSDAGWKESRGVSEASIRRELVVLTDISEHLGRAIEEARIALDEPELLIERLTQRAGLDLVSCVARKALAQGPATVIDTLAAVPTQQIPMVFWDHLSDGLHILGVGPMAQTIPILRTCKALSMDGTFEVTPSEACHKQWQLLTVHGHLLREQDLTVTSSFVGAAFLVSRKTLDAYAMVCSFLKRWGVDPEYIVTDWEAAEMAAIRSAWPDALNGGCFWHLLQGVSRWIKKHTHMAACFKQQQIAHGVIEQARAASTPQGALDILESFDKEAVAIPGFAKYFRDTWRGKKDHKLQQWIPCFTNEPMILILSTNNLQERWHRALNEKKRQRGARRSMQDIVETLYRVLLDDAKSFVLEMSAGGPELIPSFLRRQRHARNALTRLHNKLHSSAVSEDNAAITAASGALLMTTNTGDRLLTPLHLPALSRLAFHLTAGLPGNATHWQRETLLLECQVRLVRDHVGHDRSGALARAIARGCLPDLPPLAAHKVASCFLARFEELRASDLPDAKVVAESDLMKGLVAHDPRFTTVSDGVKSHALTHGVAAVVLSNIAGGKGECPVAIYKVKELGPPAVFSPERDFRKATSVSAFGMYRLSGLGEWQETPLDIFLGKGSHDDGCLAMLENQQGDYEGLLVPIAV